MQGAALATKTHEVEVITERDPEVAPDDLPARPDVKLEWLPVRALTPDHQYQRDRQERTLKKLRDNWDDSRLGAIIVNRDGEDIRITDGGHRWEVAKELFGMHYELPCVVSENLTHEQESAAFLGINRDRKAVSGWDQFRVAVAGGIEPYASIQAMLAQYGLAVGRRADENTIGAVATVLTSERKFGLGSLELAVLVLDSAYGRAKETWDSDMIMAVARTIHQLVVVDGVELDQGRLADVVSQQTPRQWYSQATMKLDNARGGTEKRSALIADQIIRGYRKKSRKGS